MGVILKPCSRTSPPTNRTLRSLETLQWQTRHGKSGKTLPHWWQCQINFSLWCASAGCGVSFEDHLQAEKHPLLASLYSFQDFHTTRRLLEELRVALQGDKSYLWYENAYDSRAYRRLCAEFSVSPDTDWRQKVDHGCQGLRSWSTFMTPYGSYRHAHAAQGPFFNPKDVIRHNLDISGARTTFVLDKSDGFTQASVERLNNSIRTYVWAILGPQANTRSNILKTGMGFDAQKQYWLTSKTLLPRMSTSPVASPATRKHLGMRPHSLTSCAK